MLAIRRKENDISEIITKTQDIDEEKLLKEEEKLLQDEEMETNDDNEEEKESTNVKTEINEDDENVEKGNKNTAENSNADKTMENKADVEMKHEIDEKPIVDEAQKKNEQAEIEMKEVKEEPEEDSTKIRKIATETIAKTGNGTVHRVRKKINRSPHPDHTEDEPDLKEAQVVFILVQYRLEYHNKQGELFIGNGETPRRFRLHMGRCANHLRFTARKVYYETKITECCEVNLKNEMSPHVLKVGWSVQGTLMQLGEELLTDGYGGTGKISSANQFADYGTPYNKDDVVNCYLDLSSDSQAVISYTVNGKSMGTVFTFEETELDGKTLFPHVLPKNCTFVCNFGQEKSRWYGKSCVERRDTSESQYPRKIAVNVTTHNA